MGHNVKDVLITIFVGGALAAAVYFLSVMGISMHQDDAQTKKVRIEACSTIKNEGLRAFCVNG